MTTRRAENGQRRMAMAGLALVALTALGLAGCRGLIRAEAEWETSIPVPATPLSVQVTSRNGGITLQSDPTLSVAQVRAKVTARGASRAEARERAEGTTVRLVLDEEAGTLQVEPEFPGGWQDGDGAVIDLRIPALRAAKLHTSNGNLTVSGVSGAVDGRTSNGKVRIEDAGGPVNVRSSNGALTLVRLAGEVEAETSNGSIRGEALAGALKLRTSNGRIELELADGASGPIQARSSNGAVRLELPASLAGSLVLETSNGRLRVSDPAQRLVVSEVGKARGRLEFGLGPESRVTTSNGPIEVTVRAAP